MSACSSRGSTLRDRPSISSAMRMAGKVSCTSAMRMMTASRSEEHTSELQSLMRNSYAVFCLKKKTNNKLKHTNTLELHHNTDSYTIYIHQTSILSTT